MSSGVLQAALNFSQRLARVAESESRGSRIRVNPRGFYESHRQDQPLFSGIQTNWAPLAPIPARHNHIMGSMPMRIFRSIPRLVTCQCGTTFLTVRSNVFGC